MEVVLDGRRICSRDDFYAQIERIEGVPDWFGRNLDALFDLVLAALPGPLTIRWIHAEASAEAMGADFGISSASCAMPRKRRNQASNCACARARQQSSGSRLMADMMKALAKTKPAEGLELIDAPIPVAGDEDVLIKVHRTAVCGTDIHIWNWDEWSQKNVPVPMITGHEFAGEIVAIGKDVDRRLKVGQRVSAEGHVIDLNSEAARAGHFHLDPDTRGIGVNRQGAFAEYVVAPAFNVIELPDEVPYEIGSILDPFGNAVHTAQQFDLLGEDVIVTGAGPIGMMAAAVARHAGARTVVLTDINDFRLELAQKVAPGIRAVNTTKEDLRDVMHELGLKVGFDVALEMSGSPIAFKQCVDTLIMGGGMAMLGIPSKPMETDWGAIILKALTIKGVYGREMFTTWRKMLGLLKAGLDLSPLITHQMPYQDFEAGFEAMRSGKSGKVVLNWAD
ncbi:L-threonine 3-dehydrogenase [Brevundimonas diminuta]|uniref:L-threonine 3-dehydrogenase n=1 Tax=Brevundimonas diminuta TaxID=293 RepID=UPI003D024027